MFKETGSKDGKSESSEGSSNVAFSQNASHMQAPMVVNEIVDGCLYSGFFGRLDSARMKSVIDRILDAVEQSSCEVIIIDLSNIDIIDSLVASQLSKVGDTLRMVGVRPVFCGISSVVAQTMVGTGVSLDRFTVVRNLKSALRLVLKFDEVSLNIDSQ